MIHLVPPVPILDLDVDEAIEVYGASAAPEIDGEFECDDLGNQFEVCPDADNGHLFKTHCGETICVHCGRVAWA